MLKGARSLAEIAERVEADNIDPQPVSGRQEYLEGILNSSL